MSQWVTEIHIFLPGNSIFIGVTLKATEASSGKLASGSSSNICCVRRFLPGKLSICRIVHVVCWKDSIIEPSRYESGVTALDDVLGSEGELVST